MYRTVRYSAPGNLLLAGEYLITRPGGVGLACAVSPRGLATVRHIDSPEGTSKVITLGARRNTHTLKSDPRDNLPPLLGAVTSVVEQHLQRPLAGSREITIDTRSFFDAHGAKRGLGSSAVAAVLLTTALLSDGTSTDPIDAPLICRLATEAHRLAHGGRGSGYDIAATTFGGWGRFVGGTRPAWIPLVPGKDVPTSLSLHLSPGNGPVSSSTSVARFDRWIAGQPDIMDRLLAEGKEAIALLTAGSDWATFERGWRAAKDLGIRIGDALDISARERPDLPHSRPSTALTKAVGAGDELFVSIDRGEVGDQDDCPVEREGVRHE